MSDYTREENFRRAQAQYDAMEHPNTYAPDFEQAMCAHCENDAKTYTDYRGKAHIYKCEDCDQWLCSECYDTETCPIRPTEREPYVPLWKRAGFESYTAWLKDVVAKANDAQARAETMKTLFNALAPRASDFNQESK